MNAEYNPKREQILKTGKDREALPGEEPLVRVYNEHHANVRGAKYYAQDALAVALDAEKGGYEHMG